MAIASELATVLAGRRPLLLALGEPAPAEPAFPRLRNQIFEELIGYGFRSIAIESDRTAAFAVDDYVQGRADTVDWTTGFSHGLGHLSGNRQLVEWMRATNSTRPPAERLTFHGFGAPPSDAAPGPLTGDARPLVRDGLLAANLLDILQRERDRGPTLVFGHNRRLQRHPSRRQIAGMDLVWSGAGAIVASSLGDRYVLVAGSLGASPALGLDAPEPGTFEAALPDGLVAPGPVTGVPRVTGRAGYAPLDAATVERSDAILHVATGDDPAAEIAARILALPGVAMTRIEPDSGMPPYTWGDRFFFAGEDRMRPFATIVGHDVPGFDTASRLDRPHTYRFNVELGREEFRRVFGFGPEELAERRAGIDFAEPDRLVPHPAYGVQGWASVVNPGPVTAPEIERLAERARARSAARLKR